MAGADREDEPVGADDGAVVLHPAVSAAVLRVDVFISVPTISDFAGHSVPLLRGESSITPRNGRGAQLTVRRHSDSYSKTTTVLISGRLV